MKIKIFFSTLFSVSVLFLCSFCNTGNSKGRVLYGISREMIGMRKGKTIIFYENQGRNQWLQKPDNTFSIPDNAKEIFMFGRYIGVYRKDGGVDTYKYVAPKYWETFQHEDIKAYKNYSRVLYFGDALSGFVKGDTVDFYHKGKLESTLQFIAPKKCKSFYTAGGEGIIVTYDKGLDFYSFHKNEKWEVQEHFDYPSDMKGFLPLGAYFGFGIVKEKTVDFYITRGYDRYSNNNYTITKSKTFVFPD